MHVGGEGKLRPNYAKKWGKKIIEEGEIWIRVGITYKGLAISRQIKPLPIPSCELGLQSIHQN